MIKLKNTLRSTVQLTHDGRIVKQYHGKDAFQRFTREVKVLKHLENKGCEFVPRLLEADSAMRQIITTNCGMKVEYIASSRSKRVFKELENYGVRHEDQNSRNIIYRPTDGRFCIIDFEYAERIPVRARASRN
jgi:tRNA A-37 threonylcarbamoyl transferase component Bud32